MVDPTDEELMQRFQQGHEPAFDALFARHAPRVQQFLGQLVQDRALAEDLLQATFLSVVRARDRFRRDARVAPWLFSIAANAARDALRHRTRWGAAREQPAEESRAELAALAAPDAADRGDPALARRLGDALAQLPLEQREAVVLHYLHEWSFEEMAEALDTRATTLRVRAHRGFARLRALLADLERGER